MLQLKNITKDYVVNSELTVHALKGVSVDFRTSEFVSILGPSGCGKTTLLNIIGGLDQYTHGDLVIDGVSTKDYKDRDWDTYRNHSIGFVFQTYNLIPHQTVLKNVELALTLAGVNKTERRIRAEEALQKVGLGDQLHKRPNQMSGGQMQRVAIARALVNNPDIVLADEPTGALDTETGVQVMEILKEVAKDRLVIMVTHNPELASQYATRIIKALDGEIVDDSNPLSDAEYKAEKLAEQTKQQQEQIADIQENIAADDEEVQNFEQKVADKKVKHNKPKKKRSSMSFWTAFKLSLNNLFTKKGRTILTSFAGSIGIIGIALILSVSQGMTSYINLVQEQTLTSYPLAIESTAMDLTELVAKMMLSHDEEVKHGNDKVYNRSTIYNVAKTVAETADSVSENDLKSFKVFLESEVAKDDSKLHDAIAGLRYAYDLDLAIYARNVDGKVFGSDVNALLNAVISKLLGADAEFEMGGYYGSMATFSMNVWQELLAGNDGSPINDLLYSQYDLVDGRWPTEYNEIVLVLNEYNELSDISLYALGLLGDDYVQRIADAFSDDTIDDYEDVERSWKYSEIFEKEYMVLLASDCYEYNAITGAWEDQRLTQAGLEGLYQTKGIPLKVTGIIKPNPNATSTMLNGSICYTSALTKYVVQQAKKSPALKAQMDDPETDIFTGLPFANKSDEELTDEEKAAAYREFFAALSNEKKVDEYVEVTTLDYTPTAEGFADMMLAQYKDDPEALRQFALSQIGDGPGAELAKVYLNSLSDEELYAYMKASIVDGILDNYQKGVETQLDNFPTDEARIAYIEGKMAEKTDEQLALYYDETMDVSNSTYERNLRKLGYVDLETPSVIYIYASSFDAKDIIAEEIARYNAEIAADESEQIHYTDFVAIVMSAVTTIIDAVTYVLIAFVSISLIVSSIMIGVITLISVQERTKEIGILRAIGASKRDVSSMFNAETVIIGFASGLFGVLFTYLLCIPINLILHALTGIGALSAYLPPLAAVILVLISMGLTLISGIIPSRSAAKKDPVTALRTE